MDKKLFIFFSIFLMSSTWQLSWCASWMQVGNTDPERIQYLLDHLTYSKMGKALLLQAQEKAEQEGRSLKSIFSLGSSSMTDTVFYRKFANGGLDTMQMVAISQIIINREMDVIDAICDLAHELTHFINRIPFNPYSQQFSLTDFILYTVEGKGGEVDAFFNECLVLQELFPNSQKKKYFCDSIRDANQELSRDLGIKQFYKLGAHFASFIKLLTPLGMTAKHFPWISAEDALFISANYNLPYPLAAIKEYLSVYKKSCDNDRKRLLALQKDEKVGKLSENAGSSHLGMKSQFKQWHSQYIRRCERPFAENSREKSIQLYSTKS